MMKSSLIMAGLMLSSAATAKVYPTLASYTESTLEKVSEAVESAPTPPAGELNGFYVQVTAKAGFDVGFGKVELIPQLELVWKRE